MNKQEKTLDLKAPMTTLSLQNNQITFGTRNGLTHYFETSQLTDPDYVKIITLTIDATPLNYNTFLPDTQNKSLNSTVIHYENLNGTRNLTQQDIQTPSHYINQEIVQQY